MQGVDLAYLVGAGSSGRLGDAARAARTQLAAVNAAVKLHEDQLVAQHQLLARGLQQTAAAQGARGARPPALGAGRDKRVPSRLTRAPLGSGLPAINLPAERAAWYSSREFPLRGSLAFELLNFVDGKRTVAQIRDALSAEFVPVPVEAVGRYLDDLASLKIIDWR